ncbi:MAG: universal stress protein [Rhodospirillales bacterium]|nr:universal stress protein [Rhodospirillales bacterium]
MGLKDILVHVDWSETSRTRVQIAADLAKQHGAHLTGLYVMPTPYIPTIEDYSQLPSDYFQEQIKSGKEEAAAAETDFKEAAETAGIESEWRCAQGHVADSIRTHARYCDLLIVGQRNPDTSMNGRDLPDGVLLSVGRPVLVVPYAGKMKSLGKRVMVGWDSSAQATRAVHDALPLISKADHVDIIAVNPEGTGDHGEIPCADISLHLARHGITAEAQSIAVSDIGVADILLSRAADKGVDLFVMGAYGHSRLRELVLGGVTAHMLEHMTVPVLMAH